MKTIAILFASVALSATAAAQTAVPTTAPAASATAQVKPGAAIYDTSGAQAATVESVANGLVVVSTGTNKVTLPIASFAAGEKGPVVSVTKAQLDAASVQGAAQSQAALKASLVPGAEVRAASGTTVLGTVKSISEPNVVVATEKGDIAVPSKAFGPGGSGAGVVINMTEAEFAAAVAAVKPGA